MTALIPEATIRMILSSNYDGLSAVYGVVIALALLILLVLKEFLRILEGGQKHSSLRVFDIAIFPLLGTFGFVILLRLLSLLGIL
jgi:hypothetical protein